jgi:ABC-type dipeptide/oligopeptide/nickel transport system permease subunit
MLRRALGARGAVFGAIVLVSVVLMAVFAPLLAPYDPLKQDLSNLLATPDAQHLFGTDNNGRDVLSRVIWGTRVSLMAGIVAVGLAVLVGCSIGLAAGFWGGQVDGVLMRLIDAVLSFPALVLALALGAVLGAGLGGVLIALGVVYTPTFARLMRGQVLSIRTRDYVQAARVLGGADLWILLRHILPNASTPIVVQASLSVGFAILAEASLSFLGLGVQPPEPSWGSMINTGRGYLQQAPWMVFGPGAALFVTVLGLNFVGDAVRDALDPRSVKSTIRRSSSRPRRNVQSSSELVTDGHRATPPMRSLRGSHQRIESPTGGASHPPPRSESYPPPAPRP